MGQAPRLVKQLNFCRKELPWLLYEQLERLQDKGWEGRGILYEREGLL
jgi:hypothetical protein